MTLRAFTPVDAAPSPRQSKSAFCPFRRDEGVASTPFRRDEGVASTYFVSMHYRGSVLMETVIVMPILLLLIFGIIQTAMIWTGKQLTVYAAYCAARAITVVRAPAHAEDEPEFTGDAADTQSIQEQDEAARRAAKTALAWVCFYDSNEKDEIAKRIQIPGWGAVDQSGSMDNRIGVKVLNRGTKDSEPFVSVRVTFKMSLMMPVMGVDSLMAKAAASDGSEIYTGSDFYGNLAKAKIGAPRMYGLPYITFTEVCTIPMPYSTRNFPRGAYDWTDSDRVRFDLPPPRPPRRHGGFPPGPGPGPGFRFGPRPIPRPRPQPRPFKFS